MGEVNEGFGREIVYDFIDDLKPGDLLVLSVLITKEISLGVVCLAGKAIGSGEMMNLFICLR